MSVEILKNEFDRKTQALKIGREDAKRHPELIEKLRETDD